MIPATEVKVGNVIQLDGKHCKVLTYEMKGTGQFGKTVNLRLKVVEDGHIIEKSYRAEEKVDNVDVRYIKLQYLYRDGDNFVFMNNENFEQYSLSAKVVGKQELFLKENAEINIGFDGDQPISIDFPKFVDLKVVIAPPGAGGRDSTYKEIELENGLKILAPQFVKEGEVVRVNVEDFSYLERLTVK
ncbi:MAG: elongation factor P, partial [Candidatus Omnitrophica bacterium]|nr:elongation factor P [Candidatus Omnitrophota bacterium]